MSRYKTPIGTHNLIHPKRTDKKPFATRTSHQVRRQRAQALAKHLETLSSHYPEYAHLIQDPLLILEQQTQRALVLHAIHEGAWTIEEIQRETRLPRQKVRTIIEALVQASILFTTSRKHRDEDGGRPVLMYLPAPNSHP